MGFIKTGISAILVVMKVGRAQARPGDLQRVWALQGFELDHYCNSSVSTLTRRGIMLCQFQTAWLDWQLPLPASWNVHSWETLCENPTSVLLNSQATWNYFNWQPQLSCSISCQSCDCINLNITTQVNLQITAAPADAKLNCMRQVLWKLLSKSSQNRDHER